MTTIDLSNPEKKPSQTTSWRRRIWSALSPKSGKTGDGKIDSERASYYEGISSIIINSLLFVLKLWVGIITGTLTLITDAWHTLSDSLSSLVVVVTAKLAQRRPDHEHQFGHGRWEQIAALFIAFLLAMVAFEFFLAATRKLLAHQSVVFGTSTIVVMIVSVVIKEAMASYAFYLSDETGSEVIKADGWHHRSDALSSLVVLVGIFLAGGAWWLDGVLSILIAAMILYAAIEIARATVRKMLGEIPSEQLITEINLITQEICQCNFRLHHFHIHNYGQHRELTFHLKLDRKMTIEDSHMIATQVEKKIKERFAIHSTIHIEPADSFADIEK